MDPDLNQDLNYQAEILAQKIRHYLISTSGHISESATIDEFYQAFCTTLKEEVMINWMASLETIQTKKVRVANYFSMEYLPGRLTGNNLTNMGANQLVKAVMKKMNRNFSDFISCEPDPGLGNGGLGRLASCFLDSLATLHYPARAYGLRYQYGIFEQELWGGIQIERPDCWLLNMNPWEVRRDRFAQTVCFRGKPIKASNKHGEDVYLLEDPEEVRALPYDFPIVGYAQNENFSVIPLRLWSTKESPRNFQLQQYNAGLLDQAAENTSLTDVLYPNDNTELGKRLRLKQEFLLVSASLHDIIRRHLVTYGDLSQFADKQRIQINDTHPSLTIAEMVRILTKNYDFSWQQAWETCQTICSYTNHTILKEALEEWSETRIKDLMPRQYSVIQKLNHDFCTYARSKFPNDEEKIRNLSIIEKGQVRMAHLAIVGSHKVNGVAKLHSDILKEHVFKDFDDLYPEKFTNVTNGVTQRRWLLHSNPLLAEFITKRIGDGWITDFKLIAKLASFASDKATQEEFLSIKKTNKEALLEFLMTENTLKNTAGKLLPHAEQLPTSALFDVQVKRIHEYKRQLMNALHLIMVYQELKENPNARAIARLSLFGGKSAAGYEMAKQIILLISAIGRTIEKDHIISKKLAVIFVENYNVSKAELIIPAADLSEQISTAGWEASGTGNMKFSMNGALTIGTEDGANIEMRQAITDAYWPFKFGASADENRQPFNAWDVYLSDEGIRKAIDSLKDGTFAQTPEETKAFANIHYALVECGAGSDHFKILKDLRDYYNTQKKVEVLYEKPFEWAEMAIHNIAGMGPFSTDESIRHYADEIWGIEPCPPDATILAKVRDEYSEHDRCRIIPKME
jgi:starch phosphorylase